MRKGLLRLSLLGLALASACSDEPVSQSTTTSLGGDGSRIHRSESNRLTAPSSAAATDIVRDYLDGFVGSTGQMTLVSQSPFVDGISHVRFEQTVGGLRVHGAYVKAAITDRGELVQVIENLTPPSGLARAAGIKHKDALGVAMAEHGYEFATPAQSSANGHKLGFDRGTEFYRDPTVERVAYYEGSALKQGYLVETWSLRGNQLDYTLVGNNGQIVSTERRTQNDSYNVFVEDPDKTPQTLVVGGAGWLGAGAQTTQNITGNNAHAYRDAQSDNVPDTGGTAVTDGNFTSVADLSVSADATEANRNVAVQNLFYLNNVVHDLTYAAGFTESEGNFQEDNFGLGGLGSDSVNAEAQDGGGLDNANFATPTDGSNPRMQMYLWSGTTPPHEVSAGGVDRGAWGSSFGAQVSNHSGALAVANDSNGDTDGCETFAAGTFTGKIAIVDRGTCNFTVKVKNAQSAGAVAVLIANNDDSAAFAPGGTDRKVKIPSAMVSLADGTALKAQAGTAANLHVNPDPPVRVDGDLDSDIVFHEYGHGLTWRMIGSMSGAMSGAIGEGASDTLAFLINGDDRIGEYSFSDPGGIRRAPYINYPNTYGDFAGSFVHDDGEIYAAAMWRVLENYQANGLSAQDLLRDWVQGMRFTAPAPYFEHMRDGLLQAVAGTSRVCLVWDGFADFGIGVGAKATPKQGGRSFAITESFAKPATCP